MSIFAIGDLHLSMDPRIKKPMDIFGDRWANHS
ncbi:MAG: serine/threonine protein phosphatase, partial [Anaerovoracaceae bacterium]